METNLIMAIITALLAMSEAISFVPAMKSNGIFQLVYNILEVIGSKFGKGGN